MAFTRNSEGGKKTFNDINITPLTDIFLVLLIIMMVIAPSFQSVDQNINVPKINSGVAVEEENATVSLTQNGDMFLNGEKVNEDTLPQKLAEVKDTLTKPNVIVKADEKAKSSEIMSIMRSAQEAGYEKLVVVGEPLSKQEQKELEKENKENK